MKFTSFTLACAAAMALSAGQVHAADFLNHADVAQRVIEQVPMDNNFYSADTNVQIVGLRDATTYWSFATCAPWVSQVIKQTYNMSDAAFKLRFASTSPSSAKYHALIEAKNGFTRITQVDGIARNDVVAIEYKACAGTESGSGHTAIASGPAVAMATEVAPFVAGTRQFALPIYDSTASPRGSTLFPDVRRSTWGVGAGSRFIRLYQDVATGALVGYTWSTTDPSYFAVDSCRAIAVGRMN